MNCRELEINLSSVLKRCGGWGWGFLIVAQRLILIAVFIAGLADVPFSSLSFFLFLFYITWAMVYLTLPPIYILKHLKWVNKLM